MIKQIHPDLKPLSANLKRLKIGHILYQDEYKYILEENNYDAFWINSSKAFNNSKSMYSFKINFEDLTLIFINCLNELYLNSFNKGNVDYEAHFNDFFCISFLYIIKNSKDIDFTIILPILKELPIFEQESIDEISAELLINQNSTTEEILISPPKINESSAKKYQVFISSTFTDLIQERQACVQAILKKGHIPAGMELFTAGDKSQWEVIKRWIDESDIYLLILGGRYGTIDKETGISYTEMEYNYAVEINKPIFSLILSDEILNLKSVEIIRDYDLKNSNYISFKEKISSKMCSFPNNIDQIKIEINHSLDALIQEYKEVLKGWIKGN